MKWVLTDGNEILGSREMSAELAANEDVFTRRQSGGNLYWRLRNRNDIEIMRNAERRKINVLLRELCGTSARQAREDGGF